MRIIFIRHAEPDYSIDGLTSKGKKEAVLLSHRTKNWDIDAFFCSPLGRAKETAAPTLRLHHAKATVYDWLQEFNYTAKDPITGEERNPWDYMPDFYTTAPLMLSPKKWYQSSIYRENPAIEKKWVEVTLGLDYILSKYGYKRHDGYYIFHEPNGTELNAEISDIQLHGDKAYESRDEDDSKTIVIFAHLGVIDVMLAHLLNVSPVTLWHGTFLPPSSVTIVNAEKRLHNQAHFRIQTLGDTSHLLMENEIVSSYGAFGSVFSF